MKPLSTLAAVLLAAGCATTATYSSREDGEIDVLDRCRVGGLDASIPRRLEAQGYETARLRRTVQPGPPAGAGA